MVLICAAGMLTFGLLLNQQASANADQSNVNTEELNADMAMSNAEVVNVRVPEYRILSGEYRIGADGAVALPGLGRLNVSELSITEFERKIKAEIYRRTNREVNVAIEIALYRSVFVSGAVARAGAFPWKPGFSVLHVQALAGGIARPREVAPPPATSTSSNSNQGTQGRTRTAYDLAAALATIQRLKVERRGGSVFVTPKQVLSLVTDAEASRLASRQQALLDSRSAALQTRKRALENAKTLAVNEQGALESQRARIQEQLAGRRSMRKRLERLVRQGYSRADRVFEEQIQIAALEERLTTTTLGITRVAMAAQTAVQDLEALVKGRQAEIDLELLDLEQTVARLEIQFGRRIRRDETEDGSTTSTPVPVQISQPQYEIIRIVSGKRTIIKADRTTSLRPGDVLVVALPS